MSGTGGGGKYLAEDSGKRSAMRLMCMLSLLASIYFGTLLFFMNDGEEPIQYVFLLSCSFLLGAFAPKAIQKFMEQKIPPIAKVLIIFLLSSFLFISSARAAARIDFEWDRSTSSDVVGYAAYKSTTAGQYTFGFKTNAEKLFPGGDTQAGFLEGIEDGTWYFVWTAYDAQDNESGPSNEVMAIIDVTAPTPPTRLRHVKIYRYNPATGKYDFVRETITPIQ